MSVVIYCISIVPTDLYYICILFLSEEKILHCVLYKDENQEILVKLLWQTFKFFKYIYIYIYTYMKYFTYALSLRYIL